MGYTMSNLYSKSASKQVRATIVYSLHFRLHKATSFWHDTYISLEPMEGGQCTNLPLQRIALLNGDFDTSS